MMWIWVAAAGFLIWYLVKHQTERPAWVWAGLGAVGVGLIAMLCGGFGFGRGMMGRFGVRGMMGGRGGMMGGQGGMMGGQGGQGGMMGPNGMMGRGGMMGPNGMMGQGTAALGNWWWVPMAVRAVVVVALVVVGIILVRRWLKANARANSPLGVLQARLARGEISAEEFDTLRSKLEG